ncbi:head GIN domain-containing protein [Flagellimonas pacifica]|uniref:Putative auto-transporter adhesin, head GIN domain n=1 Tax=Flagellimonas pacifica TaxID=1247520 RepID=A0A285MUK5_9FLAO|nr:head GIN domain-containing protein [Allomuricauda parva]SNZ00879.1 Putative auto-transporter adhesin, head GIN domain [Allomuricauda parva]
MKKTVTTYLALLLIACNGENTPDCFQNAGDLVRKVVEVPDFDTITVFENINLVIKEGVEQQVEIETGEFLQNEVTASVKDNRLILKNENGCNFIRNYGLTTIYVTSPNITEIRSSTGLLISSDGILNYPNLRLISESFNNPETETTDGSFDLMVNSENIGITVNGIAYFKLSGATTNFNIGIAAGDSRIEAEGLTSQNVSLNHRGSNDIFVNPQVRISGVIRGTGDVISINRPSEVEVEELFNGRLIFKD